ncbi:MAG TPA: tRNA pseudouridine(55) synthase TruB [Steroidobacteraceae bacterium]|nr:tRNA pseudouridine(55) synthase TruB [Steroidobacteraceae bacterium]
MTERLEAAAGDFASINMHGILLLDKPAGMSSNAVLQRVRRLYGGCKAGHAGSLDPLATGMLPLCLGEATKIAGEILSNRKHYRFTVALGARTATGDREGPVVEEAPVPAGWQEGLQAALRGFLGPGRQVPPMYSALKRDGQPLYRLARAGVTVERAAREIEIFALEPVSQTERAVELDVLCSKGTYVRTLAEDIARALRTCGHVAALRRSWVEPFEAERMETLEALTRACEGGGPPKLLPPDRPLAHLPAVSLDCGQTARMRHGQEVVLLHSPACGRVRLYDAAQRFLGLGESDGRGKIRPRRLFQATSESK